MKIKIELLSDLCPANGESMAGIVDSDINLDEFGIPYIPSKRLKGSLREMALELQDLLGEEFDKGAFNNLFGVAGSDNSGSLFIKDGYVEGYKEIVDELSWIKRNEKLKLFANNQYTKDYYTASRTQTSIDGRTGVAKKETLRVSRVINKGNIFYFDVKVDGENGISLLNNCCKILRHIGLNRTRGFGEIKCELIKDNVIRNDAVIENRLTIDEDIDTLEYVLELKSQIISSIGSNDSSEDYLSGSSILGYFANQYIKTFNIDRDNAHQDSIFAELFLNGNIKFSNAYITAYDYDRYHYIDYFPCPASLVKYKNEDVYKDLAYESTEEQTKKVNGLYAHFTEYSGFYIKSVEKELEYHHQRPKDRSIGHAIGKKDGQTNMGEFYQYNVLRKGQFFKGYISGNNKDLLLIVSLILQDKIITIGKSKTAQYGSAEIILYNFINKHANGNKKIIKKGDKFSIQLLSPMILTNVYGHYSSDPDDLIERISQQIGEISCENKFIKYKLVSGFNTKWMLPKPKMLAIDAGSIIKFTYLDEKDIDLSILERNTYGLRTNEGFGVISFNINDRLNLEKDELTEENNLEIDSINYVQPVLEHNINKILLQEIKQIAIEHQKKNTNPLVANSFINKLNYFLINSRSIQDFIEVLYQIYQKDTQKDKVKNFINLIFDQVISNMLIKKFDNNQLNVNDNEKENIYSAMTRNSIAQCSSVKTINDNKELYTNNLKRYFENRTDYYLKEYYLQRIRSTLLRARTLKKERRQENASIGK